MAHTADNLTNEVSNRNRATLATLAVVVFAMVDWLLPLCLYIACSVRSQALAAQHSAPTQHQKQRRLTWLLYLCALMRM